MATPVRVQEPTRVQAAAWELGAYLRHVDYLLVLATGGLLAYGLWVLESVTKNDVAGDPDYYVFRQIVYVAVGAVLLRGGRGDRPARVPACPLAPLRAHAVLLLVVFVVAAEVRGSKRWIQIGFFNFQPSELGKVADHRAGELRRRARRQRIRE